LSVRVKLLAAARPSPSKELESLESVVLTISTGAAEGATTSWTDATAIQSLARIHCVVVS